LLDGGSPPASAVWLAAARGDHALVAVLVKAKADTGYARGHLRWTPLHEAACHCFSQVAAVLCGANAEVDAVDSDRRTPLHLAVDADALGVVEVLRKAEASCFLRDSRGSLPIDCASRPSADPGSPSPAKDRQLMRSETRSRTSFTQDVGHVLVPVARAGDKRARPGEVYNFLARWARDEVAQVLFANKQTLARQASDASPAARFRRGVTTVSLSKNTMECLSAFIPIHVPFDTRFASERTVMHCATIAGLLEVARWLRNPGLPSWHQQTRASLDEADDAGRTALHYAVERGDMSFVDFLLDEKADLESRDSKLSTPLILAAVAGHVEVARKLCESHPRPDRYINSSGTRGSTALHFAAEAGNLPLCKILLSMRGDPLLKTRQGKSAVTLAEQHGHQEVGAVLTGQDLESSSEEWGTIPGSDAAGDMNRRWSEGGGAPAPRLGRHRHTIAGRLPPGQLGEELGGGDGADEVDGKAA